MYDPMFDKKADEKTKEYHKIYSTIQKYFNLFKMSRNPFTICWLLELLNIVTLKFKQEDAKLDNRLKKDFHEVFNNLLTNCSSIISDQFNIKFAKEQKYNLCFPPSVYEMLWRYEYISFKSTIVDQDKKIE